MAQQVIYLQPDGRWPADVEVWRVVMPTPNTPLDDSVLDGAELARAACYLQHADRVRYMATRSALRELLAKRLSIPPASVRLTVGRWGKPELVGTRTHLSFNVSHSGEHALIAISDSRVVGVDVERIDPDLKWRDVANLVCTPQEQVRLNAEPASTQVISFFRCWTAKEALLKALGLGIAEGLSSLDVGPLCDGLRRADTIKPNDVHKDAADFQYHWLTEIPGYIGCVAFGGLWGAQTGSYDKGPFVIISNEKAATKTYL
jgi:4'-phosphopantetheinyl transferase